jgi:hypothetical protein
MEIVVQAWNLLENVGDMDGWRWSGGWMGTQILYSKTSFLATMKKNITQQR